MLRHTAARIVPRSTRALTQAPRTPALNRIVYNAAFSTRNPELPKFSLDGLGLSKNMKTALIVILGIFGTIETWVWCKAIWRWWNGEGFALRGKPSTAAGQ